MYTLFKSYFDCLGWRNLVVIVATHSSCGSQARQDPIYNSGMVSLNLKSKPNI